MVTATGALLRTLLLLLSVGKCEMWMFLRVQGPLVCGPGFLLKFQQPRLTQSQHLARSSTLNPDKSICIVINTQPPPHLSLSLLPFAQSVFPSLCPSYHECDGINVVTVCLRGRGGGFGYISRLELTETLSHIDIRMAGALRLGQELPLAVVCNPRHYLPPLVITGLPHRTTFCLPTIAFAPPHMATTMCIFFRYARSTLWTSRLFLPPVHNSNGQRPLLVLTGLEDLGFAHSAVTQLLVVFRGLCD